MPTNQFLTTMKNCHKEIPCVNLTLDMDYENSPLSEQEMNSIMRDRSVSSANKVLEKTKVKVISMYLSFEKNPQ